MFNDTLRTLPFLAGLVTAILAIMAGVNLGAVYMSLTAVTLQICFVWWLVSRSGFRFTGWLSMSLLLIAIVSGGFALGLPAEKTHGIALTLVGILSFIIFTGLMTYFRNDLKEKPQHPT